MAETAREKIHPIHDMKKSEGANPEDSTDARRKGEREMGKVAIIISILSVLLIVIFFFGLNQNITGLNQEVQALSDMRQEVGTLSARVGSLQQSMGGIQQAISGIQENVEAMEGRLVQLEGLPAQTRNMIILNELSAMDQRLGYIGSQVTDEQQTASLQEAQKLLQQLQTQLSQ